MQTSPVQNDVANEQLRKTWLAGHCEERTLKALDPALSSHHSNPTITGSRWVINPEKFKAAIARRRAQVDEHGRVTLPAERSGGEIFRARNLSRVNQYYRREETRKGLETDHIAASVDGTRQ